MLIFSALVFSILEWIGEYKTNRVLIYFTKPLVIMFLILWILLGNDLSAASQISDRLLLIWFLIGLVFCLVGDVFLMLAPTFFIPGMVAFIGGHVFYIITFGRLVPKERDLIPAMALFLMVTVVTWSVNKKIALGLDVKNNKRIKLPIVLYSIIISAMLYSAFLTLFEYDWDYRPSFLVCLGALAFYFSDILNAWHRFVGKVSAGRIKVMMLYHFAQIVFTIGVVLQYQIITNL